MSKFFTFLFSVLFISQAFSVPVDIIENYTKLSAECEPLLTEGDCVNVLTGHFYQMEEDFKGNTIDPLEIVRYYDSGILCESFLGANNGSQFALFATSKFKENDGRTYTLINEKEGFFLPYVHHENDSIPKTEKEFILDKRVFKNGLTNISKPSLSNQENLVNRTALLTNELTLNLGSGAKRIYGQVHEISKGTAEELGMPSTKLRLLTKETKSNGNNVFYDYTMIGDKPFLKTVKTFNRDANLINEINITYDKNKAILQSSCGQKVVYSLINKAFYRRMDFFKERRVLKKVTTATGTTQYHVTPEFTDSAELARINSVEKTEEPLVEIEYTPKHKVSSIYKLVGANDSKILAHRFEYHSHSTDVWNALDQKKTFSFDSSNRLKSIEYFDISSHSVDGGPKCVKKEEFNWYICAGREGWLKDKSIYDGKNLYSQISYEYDAKGNLSKIIHRGNITGNGCSTYLDQTIGLADYNAIDYQYSNDGRNLLIRKETQEGCVTAYDYLPETDLRTKELISYEGKIQKRKFWSYDQNGQPQTIIEDDGSGFNENDLSDVTTRKIIKITAETKQGASFGKPVAIAKLYFDGNTYVLLNTVRIKYNSKGLETSREYYDSRDEFCYSKTKSYDAVQRVVGETNALGDKTKYVYDSHNNLVSEETLGSGVRFEYTYDGANRRIAKTEIHADDTFITTYSYDLLGRVIKETDPNGHETAYQYDRLGRQTLVFKPAVQVDKSVWTPELAVINEFDSATSSRGFIPTIRRKYNVLNQVISETNENGYETKTSYNIYGQPTNIIHPDKSQEFYIYYRSGLLKSKQQTYGACHTYTYDAEGKLLSETILGIRSLINLTSDIPERKTEYRYKGSLLKEKIDHLGVITRYEYDGAGRKISEKIEGLKTRQFVYDDFDRVVTTIESDENNNTRIELVSYDWMDRIVSKETRDCNNVIYSSESCEFDQNGNLVKLTVLNSENQAAITKYFYNSKNQLISKTNALNETETWVYNNRFRNKYGELVILKNHFDAEGRLTIEEFDSHNRLFKNQVYDNNNQVISACEYSYDFRGNLIKTTTQVKDSQGGEHCYSVVNAYDTKDRLASETEQPSSRKTSCFYDGNQRLSRRVFPDNTSIVYTYDVFGRRLSAVSSDGSISYHYKYALGDLPISITDDISKTVQFREYDSFERLINHTSSTHATTKYEYDGFGRIIKTVLPDSSYISYQYNPYYLTKIERFSDDNQLLYDYHLDKYDMVGNLLKSHSNNLNQTYQYNLMGKPISIITPEWTFEATAYDKVGNLKSTKQSDPSGSYAENFEYDRFDYLVSEPNHSYVFDSLGNCLKKDKTKFSLNDSNQIANKGFAYSTNGNLVTSPKCTYKYDALNRLTATSSTQFQYDAYDKCIKVNSAFLLYQGNQEIGLMEGKSIKELRIGDASSNKTYVIELDNVPYFPVQNNRGDICGLYNSEGKLVQWRRYSAFGNQSDFGDTSVNCPWGYNNRRHIDGLVQYQYRFYDPTLIRWLTPDPLSYKESLNLYRYTRNNPNRYYDPNGKFTLPAVLIVVEFFTFTFGPAAATTAATTAASAACTITAAEVAATATVIIAGSVVAKAGRAVYNESTQVDADGEELFEKDENFLENGVPTPKPEQKEWKKPKNENNKRGGPPRDPRTSAYLPDPLAEGVPHSTFGIRIGTDGVPYSQGATFDENGKLEWRTDVTTHGSRRDHPYPHRHRATGPDGAKSRAEPIPWLQ